MLDEKDQVEYIHAHNGEKITPLYRYKTATELLSYLPNSSLGFFEYTKDENNLASYSTPKLAISPVATRLNDKLFHLFITDNVSKSIEVWNNCRFYDNDCLFDFHGKLELKGITGFGGLAIENSGKDLSKVSDDVTFCNLYVACPNESKIKYIEIPMSFEEKSQVNSTLNIEHKALTKPMDIAVKTNSNSFGHTLVAVFNGKCGRIFLFCKTDDNCFNLLKIYARSIVNPPSNSRVFFDSSNNLWVSSYNDAQLLIPVASNNETEKEVRHKIPIVVLIRDGSTVRSEFAYYVPRTFNRTVPLYRTSVQFLKCTVPTYRTRTIPKNVYRTSVPYFLAKIEAYRTAILAFKYSQL